MDESKLKENKLVSHEGEFRVSNVELFASSFLTFPFYHSCNVIRQILHFQFSLQATHQHQLHIKILKIFFKNICSFKISIKLTYKTFNYLILENMNLDLKSKPIV